MGARGHPEDRARLRKFKGIDVGMPPGHTEPGTKGRTGGEAMTEHEANDYIDINYGLDMNSGLAPEYPEDTQGNGGFDTPSTATEAQEPVQRATPPGAKAKKSSPYPGFDGGH